MAISLVYHKKPTSNSYVDLGTSVFDMTHAGQESYTMSVSDGNRILPPVTGSGIIGIKDLGDGPEGFAGVGRNSSKPGLRPSIYYSRRMGNFSLAFDGYFLNGDELREKYGGETDAEMTARFIADSDNFEDGIEKLAGEINGHFCVTVVSEMGDAFGARSPLGVRTLIHGSGEMGYALVSESRALSHINMAVERDLRAGEIVAIDGSGMYTIKELPSQKKVCSFLWPYYQMADCVVEGIPVAVVKERIGRHHGIIDKKAGLEIDVSCAVPDSGKDYDEGYAMENGCVSREILKKYQYAGRSYDRPDQFFRDLIATVKITVIPHKASGKNIIVMDDSIRRGTQAVRKGGPIDLLKNEGGAKEVHLRVCSPPEEGGYKDSMLAANKFSTNEALANYLGVDSVSFIDLEPFVDAITMDDGIKRDELCLGCYNKDFGFLGIDL